MGLSATQPPLNMKNRAGEIIGLEVELAEILAQSMNIELRFVERPFAELIDALENDEVDLVISGMTITPERNARVAFAGHASAGSAEMEMLAGDIREWSAASGIQTPAFDRLCGTE